MRSIKEQHNQVGVKKSMGLAVTSCAGTRRLAGSSAAHRMSPKDEPAQGG